MGGEESKAASKLFQEADARVAARHQSDYFLLYLTYDVEARAPAAREPKRPRIQEREELDDDMADADAGEDIDDDDTGQMHRDLDNQYASLSDS